jgi:hypothetical protein
MSWIELNYSSEPAFDEGYAVHVNLHESPLVYAYVEKLKWVSPTSEENGGHKAVGYPRVIMAKSDVDLLHQTLVSLHIPVGSRFGEIIFDGILNTLRIGTTGYSIEVQWCERLPDDIKELEPIIAILDAYAQKSLVL